MKRIVFYTAVTLAIFLMVGCKKETSAVPDTTSTADSAEQDNNAAHVSHFDTSYDFSNQVISKGAFHTDAHQQFLNDPMQFSPLPDQGIAEGKSAVVGSRVCVLYPEEAFVFADDTHATLSENIDTLGAPIPFSSIVSITGDRLRNAAPNQNEYANEMFEFQSNWNWFYPVEWQGKKGWVYGADLYGLNDNLESNRISAEIYRTSGRFESFYPVTGYLPLSDAVADSLEQNKLALQKVRPNKQVSLDDMVELYTKLRWQNRLPIFVTTDFAAHCQHLIFDRMLQHVEESYFTPRLQELTDAFIAALNERTDAPEEIRAKAIQYFEVPQLILRTGPERKEEGERWRKTVTYEEKSASKVAAIVSEYGEAVQADYNNVMQASGRVDDAIFGVEEDFSQYKPRGHYNKNGTLQTYFRAEMWYGRIHFLIARSNFDQATEEKSLEMEPVALLITDTVQKNPDLYRRWADLFNPITTLIGASDDLSLDDVLPLWKEQDVSDFGEWATNTENLTAFMTLCHQKLRPPAISGNSLFTGFAATDADATAEDPSALKPPMGWRLFGQRFTYDSYIHNQVSPPRLMSRDIVRGLDVMKAFGSKTAESLLGLSDYPEMDGLKETLDALQAEFSEYESDFWNQTYYNQILYQVKTLATFEQGAGFYFTESPAWNIKSQLTAHGTWAELRHDTILYVKQSYAERAGDGDFEPTFRTEPLPKPTHYIEPNIPFWRISLASVGKLYETYATYDLLDDESMNALENLQTLYKKILAICEKEAENKPITAEENDWIPTIASNLGYLILVHTNGDRFEDNDQLKMACIADVFTNAEYGVCLEVGVGNPHRIYVPLNDSQGGKRIAVGYTFSYYEFTQPMNDRLTDEQWKDTVYRGDYETLTDYMPFWEKECLLSPQQNDRLR